MHGRNNCEWGHHVAKCDCYKQADCFHIRANGTDHTAREVGHATTWINSKWARLTCQCKNSHPHTRTQHMHTAHACVCLHARVPPRAHTDAHVHTHELIQTNMQTHKKQNKLANPHETNSHIHKHANTPT